MTSFWYKGLTYTSFGDLEWRISFRSLPWLWHERNASPACPVLILWISRAYTEKDKEFCYTLHISSTFPAGPARLIGAGFENQWAGVWFHAQHRCEICLMDKIMHQLPDDILCFEFVQMNFNLDSWSWMILRSLQRDFCWENRGHDHRAVANTLLNLGRAVSTHDNVVVRPVLTQAMSMAAWEMLLQNVIFWKELWGSSTSSQMYWQMFYRNGCNIRSAYLQRDGIEMKHVHICSLLVKIVI